MCNAHLCSVVGFSINYWLLEISLEIQKSWRYKNIFNIGDSFISKQNFYLFSFVLCILSTNTWDAEAASFQLPYAFSSEISTEFPLLKRERRAWRHFLCDVLFCPPVSSPFHLPE